MLKRTYENKNGELQQIIENSGMEIREFTAISLERVNVKSKKKRIRQKALKKALSQTDVVKDILVMVQGEKEQSKPSTKDEKSESNLTVRGLPVTTLLKLGKRYLKEEDVVRYYYNAEKEEFYKNKAKLETIIEESSKRLESSEFVSYQKDLKEELDKRNK
ncbi:hypothetical protein ACFFHM_20490 [Halalkalibacter kiskunsagensis]|uniref:Uncharacterized protein n=1 Tax=Halalkalibacter kiskunsagensis TaxID=1548599 RepID=A0ABV6KIP8_9BACI